MNIAIYTTQLIAERRWRMPWRTVLEVAQHWSGLGHKVVVFSGDGLFGEAVIGGISVRYVDRPRDAKALARFMQELLAQGVVRLYFPIAPGRANRALARALVLAGIAPVWYFPGAWYTFGQVLGASRVLPWRSLGPYLVQALVPKRAWVRALRDRGSFPLITMTPFTAERLVAHGYPARHVFPVLPGRAPVRREAGAVSDECRRVMEAVSGRRFFVFFGPPSPIRGVIHLLRAFHAVERENGDCHLVCLFRADENITDEPASIRLECDAQKWGGRLHTHWKSVSPSELDWFLTSAFAVLKPFVIVPSEIPLAVIETAEYGKPVLGFSGDGTGEYISRIGVAVPRFASGNLAQSMLRLLDSETHYRERCQAAKQVYAAHPAWREVADRWLAAGGAACD